ncbi:MAG TPA: beta-CASP ribonuclease aCPSF1, partial [Nitrososphaeraceae archaeon]|nr:beta-CASP ribonuclease aCPSF1 [Nitrososphaeraceae archaeon]
MNNEILDQNTDGNESLTIENARKTRNISKNKKSIGQNNSEKRDRLDEDDILVNVIRPSIPKESEITSAKFEGPNISLYTLNPKFSLTELTYYLSSLSRSLKKRFIIRSDPSIRLSEEETRSTILKILPNGVSISAVFCDDATGEVVLEVSHPELITPTIFIDIAEKTGWI